MSPGSGEFLYQPQRKGQSLPSVKNLRTLKGSNFCFHVLLGEMLRSVRINPAAPFFPPPPTPDWKRKAALELHKANGKGPENRAITREQERCGTVVSGEE